MTNKLGKKALKVSLKKTSVKRAAHHKTRAVEQSFQISKERSPFVSFKVTNQTIYWSALAISILILSIWVLNIQLDTLDIINKINTSGVITVSN